MCLKNAVTLFLTIVFYYPLLLWSYYSAIWRFSCLFFFFFWCVVRPMIDYDAATVRTASLPLFPQPIVK